MRFFKRRPLTIDGSKFKKLQARRRRPSVERLEARHLLATLVWDGGGSNTSWLDARNWAPDAIPASGDSVVISNADVTYTGGDITLSSIDLQSKAKLSITAGQITVAQQLIGQPQTGITTSGAGTRLTSRASSNLTEVNLSALSGSEMILGGQSSISLSTQSLVTNWLASGFSNTTGMGSKIEVHDLTSITGKPSQSGFNIIANGSGQIIFPNLKQIADSEVNLLANGLGSYMSLPEFTTLDNWGSRALRVEGGAIFEAPKLTTIDDTNIEFNGGVILANLQQITNSRFTLSQSINLSQLTTLTDTDWTVTGDNLQFDLASLNTIDGSSIAVNGNTLLTFPNITQISAGSLFSWSRYEAKNNGTIDLSKVTRLTTKQTAYQTVITADAGGKILLPLVTSFADHPVSISVYGSSSLIDLSELVTLSTADNAMRNSMTLEMGVLKAPKLKTLRHVDLNIFGENYTPNFNAVTSIDSSSIGAFQKSIVRFPSVTRYTKNPRDNVSRLDASSGASLEFPEVTTLESTNGFDTLVISASELGEVRLPKLTTLLMESSSYDDSLALSASSGGKLLMPQITSIVDKRLYISLSDAGSQIDLRELTTIDMSWDGNSHVINLNSGSLIAPKLTTLNYTALTVSGNGYAPDLSSVTSIDNSLLEANGGGILRLPNVESYLASTVAQASTFVANTGGRLDLPALTSISSTNDFPLYLDVNNGSQILLPRVTTIDNVPLLVTATGSDSQIDLSELTAIATDDTVRGSTITLALGTLLAPKLTSLKNVSLVVSGSGFAPDLTTINRLENSNLEARSGGIIRLPNVTNFGADSRRDQAITALTGGVIDLSQISAFSRSVPGRILVTASGGGQVTLSNIASIIDIPIYIESTGTGSHVDLRRLNQLQTATFGSTLNLSQAGQVTLAENSTIDGALMRIDAGRLTTNQLTIGAGTTLQALSGRLAFNLINSGLVTIGPLAASTFGSVELNGDYTQTAAGRLQMDLGRIGNTPTSDRLIVSGRASLDGQLEVVRSSSYSGVVGQLFTLLDATTITGTFASFAGDTVGAGIRLRPTYSPRSVAIESIEESAPRIVSAQLVDGNRIVVDFSQTIKRSTFDATDIQVVGPVSQSIPTAAITWNSGTQVSFTLSSLQLPSGSYRITIGPNIEDQFGGKLDQDRDGILGEAIDDQFITTVTLNLSDLTVTNLATASNVAAPGQPLTATWTTRDSTGSTASRSITEEFYLSDDLVIGNDRLVGTNSYLSNGLETTRNFSLTMPTTGLGSSGLVYLIVRTDATNVIAEADESNNFTLLTSPIDVSASLTLTSPITSIREDATTPIRAVLSRSGNTSRALTVQLTSSLPGELPVPASVTIPAGQPSIVVELRAVADGIADGPKLVVVQASAEGFIASSLDITVVDVDLANLTFQLPASRVAEGNTLTATITRSFVNDSPLVVKLDNNLASRLSLPSQVTIPAGQASSTLILSATENSLIEKSDSASLTASAANYRSVTSTLVIEDNDAPTLSLTLDKQSVIESAGVSAISATISRRIATAQALTIAINVSSDSGVPGLAAPTRVTIPANQLTGSFTIQAIDDTLINGARTNRIRATALYPSDSSTIDSTLVAADAIILDDDGPALTLAIDNRFVREGLSPATQAVVRRSGNLSAPLVVQLTSSDPREATVPASITIDAGAESATFNIASINDQVIDGSKTVTITVAASGLAAGSETLTVSDQLIADLIIASVTAPQTADTDAFVDVSFRLSNIGSAEAASTLTQRLLLSSDPFVGDDIVLGNYAFTGVLQATAPLNSFAQSVRVRLPQQAGDYWVIAVADVNEAVSEASESNNTRATAQPIRVSAAYTATVSTDIELAQSGTVIPIKGRATLSDGRPAAFVPVTIDIAVREFKRTISAITDSSGNFLTRFVPVGNESGRYTLAARHPGVASSISTDSFVLANIEATPAVASANLIIGRTTSLSFDLSNLGEVDLNAIAVQVVEPFVNIATTLRLEGGSGNAVLRANQKLTLAVDLQALSASKPDGNLRLRVQSSEGIQTELTVAFHVVEAVSKLVSLAPEIVTGVVRSSERTVDFTVSNSGGAATGELTVLLPDAAWLRLIRPTQAVSLSPGESHTFQMQVAPTADLQLGSYNATIVVLDGDKPLEIPLTIRIVGDSLGALKVIVEDEYTYFTAAAPNVAGARVIVTDLTTRAEVFTDITNSTGTINIPSLVEGNYEIRVEAPQHRSSVTTVQVEAGTGKTFKAFLSRETVTYRWDVEQETITDRTQVNIDALFETNVPVPVVVLYSRQGNDTAFRPGAIIDFSKLINVGDTDVVEIRVANYGLIQVENVTINFGTFTNFEVTPLVRTLAVLSAKSEVVIPVFLRRIAASSPNGEAGAAGSQALASSITDCFVSAWITWRFKCFDWVYWEVPIPLIGIDPSCLGGIRLPPIDFECIDCWLRIPRIEIELRLTIPCTSEFFLASASADDRISADGQRVYGSPSGVSSVMRMGSDGVCARVAIRIGQEVRLDETVNIARLAISNETASVIDGVGVALVIRDSDGRDVTDEFEPLSPQLEGITSLAGDGQVAANSTGNATWTVRRNVDVSVLSFYTIGGYLTYREGGTEVRVPLLPASFSIAPRPLLVINYFFQRDVLSDDPFTDIVEPSVPFNLVAMVQNVGYGIANNLSIASAQPKIIENEKGLLIDFQIIASEVDGQSMSPSLIANFGSIAAGQISTARWLLTSTLQGQFIDYKAEIRRDDEANQQRRAPIQSVNIHELIHLVRATGRFDDGKFDFLTNDLEDANDTPDTLWLSDGSVHSVQNILDAETSGQLGPSQLSISLTASLIDGWNYLSIVDPGSDKYRLTRVVRSDGSEVPVGDNVSGGNAWQTDRTFIANSKRPISEFKLHLLDYGGDGKYTLIYEPFDAIGPAIQSITAPPAVVTSSVDSLTVVFTEPIDATTFSREDLILTRGNSTTNLITDAVTIQRLSDASYRVVGLQTLTTQDGEYHLRIDVQSTSDLVGNAGRGQDSVEWIKASDSLTVLNIEGLGGPLRSAPPSNITIEFSQPIEPASFTLDDVRLLRNGLEVALSGVTIQANSANSYSLQGLGALTQSSGSYALTIDATSIRRLGGENGIGRRSVRWMMDSESPTVLSVRRLPTGTVRSGALGTLEILFSEPIVALPAASISITRDGFPLSGYELTIETATPSLYRVGGLPASLGIDGQYEFTIAGSLISDLAGNSGTTIFARQWTVDTLPPDMATDLSFVRDLNVSELSGRLIGSVSESLTSAVVTDLTTGTRLTSSLLTSAGTFSIPLNLENSGRHELEVQFVDAAGNTSRASLVVYLDNQPPAVLRFEGLPTNIHSAPPESIDIVFNKPIDATSLTLSAISMTRDGQPLSLTGLAAPQRVNDTTYRLLGLAELLQANGQYQLSLDTSLVSDTIGNHGRDQASALWSRRTDLPLATSLQGRVFDDKNRNRIQDAGETPRAGWTVFIDSNRNGQLDSFERFTTTDSNGAYRFDNLIAGSYTIGQSPPNRFVQTFPNRPAAASNPTFTSSVSSLEPYGNQVDALGDNSLHAVTFFTGSGVGYRWTDSDPSTPEVIDVQYDYRSLHGYTNNIDVRGMELTDEALRLWEAASDGKLRFIRSTTAADSEIILIGVGDLNALGGKSSVGGTLALGGGEFVTANEQLTIRAGTVWLDTMERWDTTIANGNPADTFDFFTVMAHELGHALGLGHADSVASADIMDGSYTGERVTFSAWDAYLINTLLSGAQAAPANIDPQQLYTTTDSLPGQHVITVGSNDEFLSLDFGVRFSGQNPAKQHDVNADGFVSPIDILLMINLINQYGMIPIDESVGEQSHFYDINDDGQLTALDVLLVINVINQSVLNQSQAMAANMVSLDADPIAEGESASSLIALPPASAMYREPEARAGEFGWAHTAPAWSHQQSIIEPENRLPITATNEFLGESHKLKIPSSNGQSMQFNGSSNKPSQVNPRSRMVMNVASAGVIDQALEELFQLPVGE